MNSYLFFSYKSYMRRIISYIILFLIIIIGAFCIIFHTHLQLDAQISYAAIIIAILFWAFLIHPTILEIDIE